MNRAEQRGDAELATALDQAHETRRRILRHYGGDGAITEALALDHVLEMCLSSLTLCDAVQVERRRQQDIEQLLFAAVRQHGGRLRISYGALRDVHEDPGLRLRSLADLTFRHQVLELVGAIEEEDAGPAPWYWRWTERPIVEAVLGAVQLAVMRGMRVAARWRVQGMRHAVDMRRAEQAADARR